MDDPWHPRDQQRPGIHTSGNLLPKAAMADGVPFIQLRAALTKPALSR